MENRMHFPKEQTDRDAVKMVTMCAKNRRWSRLECASGNDFYYVSGPCKCGQDAHRLQQI